MKLYFLFFSVLFIGCQRGEVSDYQQYLNHNDTVKYVGKEQCRMCHAEIYDSYINTGMGKSFHHATKENSALISSKMSIIHDSVKNLSYKPFWKNDSLYLLEYRIKNNDTIHKLIQKIHYKIGSGHHTNSHIFNSKGYLYQAPYTYYTQDSIADLPPGYEDGLNSRFSREIGLECMSCHNAHAEHNPSSLNKYHVIPQGIDCERCHGPGEIHVKNKLAGDIIDTSKYIDYTIVNPARLPKDLQFDICQRCHLQGTAILNGLSSFEDFKPGMHLKDVMDVYLPRYKDNDQFIMASHADRLAQSSCFKSDNITCITCHNPHKSVNSLSKEHFDNKCKSCHDICQDKQIDNCVSCHMPKSNSLDIMHVNITDHKISIPKDSYVELKEDIFLGLQSVNNTNPSDISKAKAYLKRYESFEQKSIYLDSSVYFLAKTKDNFTSYVKYYYLKNNDKGLINFVLTHNLDTIKYRIDDLAMSYARIGEVFSRNGLRKQAGSYFLRSINLMPFVVDYKLKYAVFLISESKYELALSILINALKSNPMVKELYLNIGYIYILKKEYIVAETYFKKALSLDPDYVLAYENLVLLSRMQNKELDLISYINNILEIAPEHNFKNHLLDE
tara:strand:+ start:229 stop:2073 length:1845 start_codon:yes stop_codon:yes gene_type:complete